MQEANAFDINEFCADAYSGRNIKNMPAFIAYLKRFRHVVLWGAGNLGTLIGEKLLELGVTPSAYWDAQFAKMQECLRIRVLEPFSGGFEKESTLVVFCIANVPVSPKLHAMLFERGWRNVLRGLAVLEGIICPLSVDTPLDTSICTTWNACTVCSCERLDSLMRHAVMKEKHIAPQDILSFDRVHFIVNNFCNLRCTHCFMYMNTYPGDKKKNMRYEEYKNDIDLVMRAVDSFGVVNVFGGESFLNPELSEIAGHVLRHKNFGSLVVNTNGVAQINKQQIASLYDGRVRLAFSNYTGSLDQRQQDAFQQNLDYAKSLGLNVQHNNIMPNWNVSSPLHDMKLPKTELIAKRRGCGVVFLYVFNHRVYPCAMCLSVNDLGVADYQTDYIDLNGISSIDELRDAIRNLMAASYYQTCGHCSDCAGLLVNAAGGQGFDERYKLPSPKIC